MTCLTDTPLFPCPQCGAPTEFRFARNHYYPRMCDPCALESRRAKQRVVAERRRRQKGIAPVKGTTIDCAACRKPFVRNSIKAIRCKPCQREDYLARARACSEASNRSKGYRKMGQKAACSRCNVAFEISGPRQKHCPECRSLPDRDRWEAVAPRARVHGKKYRERHPDRVKKQQAESRERRKQNPAFTVNERMSAGVRYSLASGKQGSSWEALVGYTKDDLVAHLEKQFLPGMSWDRRSEIHIDHIVPLSSFKFDTADDPEFRAAWALSNLRPLWAIDNIIKNDRRTHLL